MKFNEKQLALVAHNVAQYEGRLEHKAPPAFRDTGGYLNYKLLLPDPTIKRKEHNVKF